MRFPHSPRRSKPLTPQRRRATHGVIGRLLPFAAVLAGAGLVCATGLADEPGIYLIAPDGSNEHKVVAVDGYDYHTSPRWSHDNQRLAFEVVSNDTGQRKLFVVNVDGSGLKELADYGMPDWSPDDKQLTCYSDGGADREGIWVINANGSGGNWVCDGAWPRWSPDGSSIAHNVGNMICILDLISQEDRTIVDDALPQRPGSFDWSRDGKQIAFFVRTQEGGPRELYIVPTDKFVEHLQPRYARPGMVGGHVTWSPDDKQLAFTVDSYIHMMEVAGNKPPVLVLGQSERSRDPAWSPDGKWIAFARRN